MQGDKTREKIIAFATMHFFTFGYSKVSTEDLVSGLAMSKSTLYKYFPSKEELLDAVIVSFYQSQAAVIEEIVRNQENGIEQKIRQFLEVIASKLPIIKTEALHDIKRTMSDAFAKLMELRKKVVVEKLALLFQEGIHSGFFRNDMEAGFVVSVFLAAIETLAKPDHLVQSPYSYDTLVQQVFTLIIEGFQSK